MITPIMVCHHMRSRRGGIRGGSTRSPAMSNTNLVSLASLADNPNLPSFAGHYLDTRSGRGRACVMTYSSWARGRTMRACRWIVWQRFGWTICELLGYAMETLCYAHDMKRRESIYMHDSKVTNVMEADKQLCGADGAFGWLCDGEGALGESAG